MRRFAVCDLDARIMAVVKAATPQEAYRKATEVCFTNEVIYVQEMRERKVA